SRVLVYVPCTGLGALRRRAEARWRRTPGNIGSLAGLQRELLASALDAAAPGGVVAYVTCSPHLAENRLVDSDMLKQHEDGNQRDARDAVREGILPARHGEADLGRGPAVQLWPTVHGTDAMFIALLRKHDDSPSAHRTETTPEEGS